jgi:GH15 family glucan-1,4-alpha-glucosidase
VVGDGITLGAAGTMSWTARAVGRRLHRRCAAATAIAVTCAVVSTVTGARWLPEPPRWIPLDRGAAAQVAAEITPLDPWLAAGGAVPGAGTPHATLVSRALLDLRALTTPDGAATAGRATAWRYVWPRDASFVAAALARSGHRADAVAILRYLQRLPLGPAGFQARYLPDGSGAVPDHRGIESDGVGWVLWAADEVTATVPGPAARAGLVTDLAALIDRCADVAHRLTHDGRSLPAPSRDYWEVRERHVTLGTVAPLLAGLSAAARLHRSARRAAAADRDAAAAGRLARVIRDRFGPHYARHPGERHRDAAVAFLLPPFVPPPWDPALLTAWSAVQTSARRPAGGLAPGEAWPDDGISWTPETGAFALTAAAVGRRADAEHWLRWLAAHRTADGAVPEKVLSDGSPAAVAPLAWTDAEIVLTAALLNTPGDHAILR